MPLLSESAPVSTHFEVDYPLSVVKDAIRYLLTTYPQYFIVKKNGINEEVGTYLFDRPKGTKTPTIRLTVSANDNEKSKIEIHCSSNSFDSYPADKQLAITEVQNILMAKLSGQSDGEIETVIRQNNSGNGFVGCAKSIGCLIVLGIMIILLVIVILNVLFNII